MCGIAGILRITPPGEGARAALERTPFDAIPEGWLEVLDASIRHRGPDGQGRFRDRAVRSDGTVVDVAFVHRRLSIIDHGGGAQPMVSQRERAPGGSPGTSRAPSVSERVSPSAPPFSFHPLLFHGKPNAPVHYQPLPDLPDTLAVVFNGCIYNHRVLRAELQAAGHRFETDHSDTEVLLHGWREWGSRLDRRLDAMHAYALWDRGAGTLICGRDPAGEKPLHVLASCVGGAPGPFEAGLVAFASTAAGVLRLRGAIGRPIEANLVSLWNWIECGCGNASPVLSVEAVFPGTTLRDHRVAIQDPLWWFNTLAHQDRPMRSDAARLDEDGAGRLVERAVASRLDADVPVGCFLSGGVDSSLVAFHARRLLGRLETFSVKMPDPRMDESAYARTVAGIVGATHNELPCDARPAQDLVELLVQTGVPLGDSSLLPTLWVSRAASRYVKAALGGDGGDEMFCGYERYRAGMLLKEHPGLWRAIANSGVARRFAPHCPEKLRRFLAAAGRANYVELTKIFTRDEAVLLGHPFPEEGPRGFPMVEDDRFGVDRRRQSPLTPCYYPATFDPPRMDFSFYLPNDLMCKVDSASMSNPLEVRSPFLARALVDACLAEPLDSLMPRGQRKGLLRAVARRHLPAHIVDRPKMGFAIPIGEWFRSDYGGLRTLLLDHMNSAEPFGPPSLGIDLNMAFVRQMLDEHLGTGPSGLVRRDHSQRLYMLLVLSIWARWLGSLRA